MLQNIKIISNDTFILFKIIHVNSSPKLFSLNIFTLKKHLQYLSLHKSRFSFLMVFVSFLVPGDIFLIKRRHHYYRRRAANSDIDRHLCRQFSLVLSLCHKIQIMNYSIFPIFQLAWRMRVARYFLKLRMYLSCCRTFFLTTLNVDILSESVLQYDFLLIFC